MSNLYEFRVITGCHTGAKAAVCDGNTLGSKPDCDIILADSNLPENNITIHIKDLGTWSLGDQVPVTLNKPQLFGDVWVTVAQVGQPWPTIADQDTTGSEETKSTAINERKPKLKNHKVTRYIILFFSVLLSTLAVFTWAINVKEPDQIISSDLVQTETVDEIETIIASMNLSGTVSALTDDNKVVSVSGWVKNVAEKERLANAMIKVWPMPSLKVYIQSEVLGNINRQLDKTPVYLTAKLENNGVEIFGIVLDPVQLDNAISNIRHKYPNLDINSNSVIMADVVMADLNNALEDALVTGVQPVWQQRYLELDMQELSNDMRKAVSAVVSRLNKKYWYRISLKKSNFSTSLPFDISSVVSGPQPYLVLTDGSKLAIGGAYKGVRLTAIKAGQLEFFDTKEIIVKR